MSAAAGVAVGLLLVLYGAAGVALTVRERRRPEPVVWRSTARGTLDDDKPLDPPSHHVLR